MLVRLSNVPRDYAWGSTTLLAQLEGRMPGDTPEAEVWFGDHPGAPALVEDGSHLTLDRWLAEHRPGTRLPYLLKLLAAAHPLSIQTHPSKQQAEAGFAREEAAGIPRDAPERSYRDDNHKPELIVALSDTFQALVGLRPLDATLRLLTSLGEDPGVAALRARLSPPREGVLREGIVWLLSAEGAPSAAAVCAALDHAQSEEFAEELSVARRLAQEAPGDPGVAVALLMNVVTLRRGEGVFVPAGLLHAYFGGLGVELMAASDNVLRGGLTGKHIDVQELAAVLDPVPALPEVLTGSPLAGAGGKVMEYATPADDFRLLRATTAEGSGADLEVQAPAIAVATRGEVLVRQGGLSCLLRPGQAVLIVDAGQVLLGGAGEVFIAQPG